MTSGSAPRRRGRLGTPADQDERANQGLEADSVHSVGDRRLDPRRGIGHGREAVAARRPAELVYGRPQAIDVAAGQRRFDGLSALRKVSHEAANEILHVVVGSEGADDWLGALRVGARIRPPLLRRAWWYAIAQCSSKKLEQRVQGDRLRDRVRRSHLPGERAQIASPRGEDDRDFLLACIVEHHLVGHAGTAEHRHVDVEQDRIREGHGSEGLQTLFPCPRGPNVVTALSQYVGETFHDVEIVIHDE